MRINVIIRRVRSDIGQRCSLEAGRRMGEIFNLGPIVYPGMIRMDFGYYQNPIENRVDSSSCGVSIYESAKD